MTEGELQTQVIRAARDLGYRVAHFRSVKLADGRWQVPVQADGKGFPDLILARRGGVLAVELKSAVGVVADDQKAWLADLDMAAIRSLVWRPADWESQDIARILLSYGR